MLVIRDEFFKEGQDLVVASLVGKTNHWEVRGRLMELWSKSQANDETHLSGETIGAYCGIKKVKLAAWLNAFQLCRFIGPKNEENLYEIVGNSKQLKMKHVRKKKGKSGAEARWNDDAPSNAPSMNEENAPSIDQAMLGIDSSNGQHNTITKQEESKIPPDPLHEGGRRKRDPNVREANEILRACFSFDGRGKNLDPVSVRRHAKTLVAEFGIEAFKAMECDFQETGVMGRHAFDPATLRNHLRSYLPKATDTGG